MYDIVFVFQMVLLILIVIGVFYMIFSDKEKNKYHKISFKNKKEYLCIYYLYGNKDLKSNIGVLSKNGTTYLLETEDKVGIHTFSFSDSEIVKIEVKEKSGIGIESQVVSHSFDFSKDPHVRNHTTEEGRNMKMKRFFNIKISLTNGMILSMESSKKPEFFFKDIK